MFGTGLDASIRGLTYRADFQLRGSPDAPACPLTVPRSLRSRVQLGGNRQRSAKTLINLAYLLASYLLL
jgi:hypothetical protein